MLELFIYFNLFLAGIATAYAIRYGVVHFRGNKVRETLPTPQSHTEDLSDAARARMMHQAEASFRKIMEHAAGELQYDLKATSDAVSGKLHTVGEQIIDIEMKRYKDSLEQLRHTTESSIGAGAAEVTKHQAELKAALAQRQKELEEILQKDMEAEKARLVADLDKKLAGAVTAFLVETLGHNVDLGAQSTYLTETLEAHKAEMIKELKDGS